MLRVVSKCASNKLSNLSFFATCMVVTIHTPTGGGYKTILSSGIAQAMVPIFFLISGLFASMSLGRYGWREFLRKKILSLVVPYLLLNLIVYGLACLELNCGQAWSFSPKMTEVSFRTMLLSLGFAKTRWCFLYPLWYVRCLILLFCLSPVIMRFLINGYLSAVMTLVGMFCLDFIMLVWEVHSEKALLLSYIFSPTGLFCFTLGMAIGLYADRIVNIRCISLNLKRSFLPWIGLGLCVIMCMVVGRIRSVVVGTLLHHYFVLPIVGVSLYVLMPTKCFPKWLVRNTFGIYVLHVLVIHYAHFLDIEPNTDMSRCFYWLMILSICVVFSEFLHRTFPRVTRVLFGGR